MPATIAMRNDENDPITGAMPVDRVGDDDGQNSPVRSAEGGLP
jgi:hypothetical protein